MPLFWNTTADESNNFLPAGKRIFRFSINTLQRNTCPFSGGFAGRSLQSLASAL
ncbi:MAG: hypothetical protein ACL7BU_02935 [Candidatus Phlomobacter fragariae]